MIFSGSNKGTTHIEMILNGLYEHSEKYPLREVAIIKTQTRRWSQRVSVPELFKRYKIGKLYAIQPKRTMAGLDYAKIKLTRKWIETWDRNATSWQLLRHEMLYLGDLVHDLPISSEDAFAEGGYLVNEYENEFKLLNPKWPGVDRVGLEFEAVWI